MYMCVRTGMSLVCRLFSTGSESGAPSAGAVVSFFVSRLRLLVCERKRAVRGPGEGAESQRNKCSAARERLSGLHEREALRHVEYHGTATSKRLLRSVAGLEGNLRGV